MAKSSPIGERLLEAFESDDKEFIAEKLGYSSVQAVYKVLSGDRELDFEKLQKFRNYTKCSIDWLLTGEGPKFLTAPAKDFDLEYAIDQHDDWGEVLQEWFAWEGKEVPDPIGGASFMGGWESYDRARKVEAIRDLKMLLDRITDGEL